MGMVSALKQDDQLHLDSSRKAKIPNQQSWSVFTPQPLRLWGIVITRGGRAGGQSEIQLLLKS